MASRIGIARKLRRHQTDAERALWFCLRNRRLLGFKFRRQAPVDRYVVDFLCADANLIIELDGGQHVGGQKYDEERTRVLEAHGYLVLRFWNNDILHNVSGVLENIAATLKPFPPHPNPLPCGEREPA